MAIQIGERTYNVSQRQTWLERVFASVVLGQRVAPSKEFSRLFLNSGGNKFPPEIMGGKPFFTSTLAVVGAEDREFRSPGKVRCGFERDLKDVEIIWDKAWNKFRPNTILFADLNTTGVMLINASTGQVISEISEMRAARSLMIRLGGKVDHMLLYSRAVDPFEQHDGRTVTIWVPETPTIGVLTRAHTQNVEGKSPVLEWSTTLDDRHWVMWSSLVDITPSRAQKEDEYPRAANMGFD